MIFSKGEFVRVGDAVGVIVSLALENDTPEEHLGIWYGEVTGDGIPLYRTVPIEYCEPIEAQKSYH